MSAPVTYLFVPGDRPDRFAKALASGADRVILDLEDAVRPEKKAAARAAIATADLDWLRIVVRVNDAASPFHAGDLALLASVPVQSVLLPKAETAAALAQLTAAAGREIELVPQIETARGLDALDSLLRVRGVARLAFGHLDFALDIGAAPDWEALTLARQTLVLRSRLAAVQPPVDSVTPDIADAEGLAREAAEARRLGFGGKLLIHPAQVAPVARAFAPSEAERDWAARVIAAAKEGAGGAVSLDGRMVDRPVIEAAERILARARL